MIDTTALFPVFVADNLAILRDFYLTHFGFEIAFFQEDFYLHLVSKQSGAQIGFLVPNHTSQPDFLHIPFQPNGFVLSLEVANAETAYEQAKQQGLNIVFDLKKEVWGQYHFMITDPAGVRLDLVQHIQPK